MCRDMQNLQREVVEITSVLANHRIIQRDISDEETEHGDVCHQREPEKEQLECMHFEERMLRPLERRNDNIIIEVPEYAGNLTPEELID